MGASASVDLRPEEIDDLVNTTSYEPKEIRTLYKRFRRLDRSSRGTISTDDLTMIPEVVMNPLSPRLVAMFERDAEDRINFRSFVKGLSVFNEKASAALKVEALFRVFDIDGDGYISEGDLRKVLSMMTGKSLSPQATDELIAGTMARADLDRDGRIGKADFAGSMGTYQWDLYTVPVKGSSRQQYFASLEEGGRTGTPAQLGGE